MYKLIKLRSILLLCFVSKTLCSQITMGLKQYVPGNENGYVLFSPIGSKQTFLIDKCGKLVNSWLSDNRPGQSVYLLSNGDLIRAGYDLSPFYNAGGKGGYIERFDWNNNLVWSLKRSTYYECLHHDFKVLPNGNILALEWSEVPLSVAFAKGRNPALTSTWIWTEKIVELQPVGVDSAFVVWQWNLFDHLVQDFDSTKLNYGNISQSPQLVNFNYVPDPTTPDWIHLNAIDYNEELDQIMLTANSFSEVWIIDHSTTAAEASGHTGGNSGKGGDLLYRWGNPAAYNRGDTTTQQLFHPHNGQWVKPGLPNEGKLLLFNNGFGRPTGDYSSIDLIDTNMDTTTNSYSIGATSSFLPLAPFWSYTSPVPTDFYSSYISGVQQLKNGGFNICSGALGNFFEIDSSKSKNWEYINPVNGMGPMTQGDSLINNNVFRCSFYYPDDSAFTSVTLISGTEIELNPVVPSLCDLVGEVKEENKNTAFVFPNPASEKIVVVLAEQKQKDFEIRLVNLLGEIVPVNYLNNNEKSEINITNLISGMYFIIIHNNKQENTYKIIVQ